MPRRVVSYNHLAIGKPRRAVAREDRTDVGGENYQEPKLEFSKVRNLARSTASTKPKVDVASLVVRYVAPSKHIVPWE